MGVPMLSLDHVWEGWVWLDGPEKGEANQVRFGQGKPLIIGRKNLEVVTGNGLDRVSQPQGCRDIGHLGFADMGFNGVVFACGCKDSNLNG